MKCGLQTWLSKRLSSDYTPDGICPGKIVQTVLTFNLAFSLTFPTYYEKINAYNMYSAKLQK